MHSPTPRGVNARGSGVNSTGDWVNPRARWVNPQAPRVNSKQRNNHVMFDADFGHSPILPLFDLPIVVDPGSSDRGFSRFVRYACLPLGFCVMCGIVWSFQGFFCRSAHDRPTYTFNVGLQLSTSSILCRRSYKRRIQLMQLGCIAVQNPR